MIYNSFHVARRIVMELGRNRRVLLMWGLFPTLMLILFGWVYAKRYGGLGPSFTATAPGILLGAAFFFSCMAGPVSVLVGERERRTLRRLLVTPLDGRSYFMGIVWAHVLIAVGQAVVVYGITLLVGGGFNGSLLLGALIMVLSVTAYVGVGFFLGARLASSTEDINGPVAAIGIPLLVIGGTFFSTELLPPFLYVVAQADPVFHMNTALRTVAAGAGEFRDVAGNVAALAAFAGAAVVLGARSYQRMLENERRS